MNDADEKKVSSDIDRVVDFAGKLECASARVEPMVTVSFYEGLAEEFLDRANQLRDEFGSFGEG